MKLLKRVAFVAVLCAGLFGASVVVAPDAEALRPRCGGQRDGTWNDANLTCGGEASNCTEITVCG